MESHDFPGRRHDTVHFSEHAVSSADTIKAVSRVTWAGVAVNVGLAVIKTAAGLLSGSRALIADAVHTISDLATDAAVLIGVRYWSAPADRDHPHGHHKIETLVTLIIGLALALVGLKMGRDAAAALAVSSSSDTQPVNMPGYSLLFALGASIISIVSKEILYRWTAAKGVELESPAVVANAWHHRSDAFSSFPPLFSVGGAAAAGWLGIQGGLWFLDPLATLVVCVMLLQAAWAVVKPTFAALLDQSADRELCSAIRKTVLATPGVLGTHCIRTRVIGSHAVEVDLHIFVQWNLSVWEGHAIAARVKYAVLALRGETKTRIVDVMVHIEPEDPDDEPHLRASAGSDTMVDWKEPPDDDPDAAAEPADAGRPPQT